MSLWSRIGNVFRGDKVNRELRSVGANIVVTQRSAALEGGVGGVTSKAESP